MGIWIRFVVGVRLWTPSGPVMNVVVKLGSSLRDRVPEFSGGEGEVELPGLEAGSVRDVMNALGLKEENVNLIYVNHRLVRPSAPVHPGDRVGLFPPNFIHFSQLYAKSSEEKSR